MVRRAGGETRAQRIRWWAWWLLALVTATACSSTPDTPPPSGSMAVSNGGALQMRPVVAVVRRSATAWDQTELTCAERGHYLRDCVQAALEAPRIVLLGSAGDKYVLGPRIVDASDVEHAGAVPDAPPDSGWSVSVNLTADGTAAFGTATESAIGSRIAIVVDGRIVSAPTVQAPITSGNVVVASGLTEQAATSLAMRLDAGVSRSYDR
jgi:preprotein translocase subunit SecD